MCTTSVFTYVYPDGRRDASSTPTLCAASRHGKPCVNNYVFHHPPQLVSYSSAPAATAPFLHQQFPPTPTYTPRSGTPNYRSGDDESDRSHRSSSSRGSNKRRSRGLYINGQRVAQVSQRGERPSRNQDRIVIVDAPPTPRTPPQTFTTPHTAPSSPSIPFGGPQIVEVSPRSRHSSSRRPLIVDERPFLTPSATKHTRHSSTSSHGSSRKSYHSAEEEVDVEARRQRREERRRQKEADEAETRRLRINERIAKANAEIASRPSVPLVSEPKRRSQDDLAASIERLSLRTEKSQEKREAENQRHRLMERMVPQRRATVGPGSRRHRVAYDDGLYRWE